MLLLCCSYRIAPPPVFWGYIFCFLPLVPLAVAHPRGGVSSGKRSVFSSEICLVLPCLVFYRASLSYLAFFVLSCLLPCLTSLVLSRLSYLILSWTVLPRLFFYVSHTTHVFFLYICYRWLLRERAKPFGAVLIVLSYRQGKETKLHKYYTRCDSSLGQEEENRLCFLSRSWSQHVINHDVL